MRRIGGRLSVESEAGRGTTFDLFLPAVEEEDHLPQVNVAATTNIGACESDCALAHTSLSMPARLQAP